MRRARRLLQLSLAFATTVLSLAAAQPGVATPLSRCPAHFFAGDDPDILNPRLAQDTREICYSGYAVLHSGITRTPLWSAEHLTRQRVADAEEMTRENAFHPEPSLPPAERAELKDYQRSGFDRGHMAPSGDMPDPQSQQESFSLANMVPQNPENNRRLWARIEAAVRRLAERDGELYVVTGPVFRGETLQRLNGRVLVPTMLYKAVYDPARRQAGAYLVRNDAGDGHEIVSLAQLKDLTGIDVFPALPPEVKAAAMPLPPPVDERSPRRRGRATAGGAEGRDAEGSSAPSQR
jgi:endonuclease G